MVPGRGPVKINRVDSFDDKTEFTPSRGAKR